MWKVVQWSHFKPNFSWCLSCADAIPYFFPSYIVDLNLIPDVTFQFQGHSLVFFIHTVSCIVGAFIVHWWNKELYTIFNYHFFPTMTSSNFHLLAEKLGSLMWNAFRQELNSLHWHNTHTHHCTKEHKPTDTGKACTYLLCLLLVLFTRIWVSSISNSTYLTRFQKKKGSV